MEDPEDDLKNEKAVVPFVQRVTDYFINISIYYNNMNKNTTSNIYLLNILQKENITINDVFPKDKLEQPLKDGFYIINLNDSDESAS